MSNKPASQLQELAKRFKGKLAQCKIYDANVCSTVTVPERPWELIPVSGEPFFERLRFVYRARKVIVLANTTYVSATVKGTFANRPFTINAKQKLGFGSYYADELALGGGPYPIFTEDGKLSVGQKIFLGQSEVQSLISASALQEGDSLFFTKGEIICYLKRPETDRIIRVTESLVDLAIKIDIGEEKSDFKSLPAQFRPLIPLIEKWGLADDSERDDLLDNASSSVIRALIEEVGPYITAIDSYLSSFRGAEPDPPATALGALAECVLEAKKRIEHS